MVEKKKVSFIKALNKGLDLFLKEKVGHNDPQLVCRLLDPIEEYTRINDCDIYSLISQNDFMDKKEYLKTVKVFQRRSKILNRVFEGQSIWTTIFPIYKNLTPAYHYEHSVYQLDDHLIKLSNDFLVINEYTWSFSYDELLEELIDIIKEDETKSDFDSYLLRLFDE